MCHILAQQSSTKTGASLPWQRFVLPAGCRATAAGERPAAVCGRAPSAPLCPGNQWPSCRSCQTQPSAGQHTGCAPPSQHITLQQQHLENRNTGLTEVVLHEGLTGDNIR